ncbi:MAG: hypothetical protein ACFE8A_12280 [Candidatus Hodarchaeota archaeon]
MSRENQGSLEEANALEEKRAKEKYEKALTELTNLGNKVITDFEDKNLKAVISDCEKIIRIAGSIRQTDIIIKYSRILEETKKVIEEKVAQEKARALEEKKAIKEQKAQEKARALEEKKALKEQKAQEKAKALDTKADFKEQQALEQIAQLEVQITGNRERNNLISVVNDCSTIITLAKSINRGGLVEKYSEILEEAKKVLEERIALERARALEEKKAIKEQKAQEKARALIEKKALKEQKAQEKARVLIEEKAIKEQKAQEKARALKEKKVIKEQKTQEKAKALDAKAALRKQHALEQIAQLEVQIAGNREGNDLILILNDCSTIITLAKSINRGDLVEKYSEILEKANKVLEEKKAQEKARALKEKRALKEQKAQEKTKALEEKRALKEAKVIKKKIKVKTLASLVIIGGILIILSSILDIILLFTIIYTNMSVTIGNESADTFFIFLYSNGSICAIGGILVIFGSVEHASENFRFGKTITGFGIAIGLIGSSTFLLVGIWAAILCGSLMTQLTMLILLFFGIGIIGIIIAFFSQKKIGRKKEGIMKSKYPKDEELLEK